MKEGLGAIPLVIHVGYSKCMSTWLQELFQEHPDIGYAFKTNYFQLYDSNFDRSSQWYISQFSRQGAIYLESDEHLLLPEIDNDLWVNKSNIGKIDEVLTRIGSVVEKPKLLFVYRSQVDMILSRYIQYVRSGGKLSSTGFLEKVFKNGNYREFCDYRFGKLHEVMAKKFGRDSIFSINMDVYKNNSALVLADLSSFLGVCIEDKQLPSSKVNVSPSYLAIKLQLMLNRFMVTRKKTHNNRAKTRFGYLVWKGAMKLVEKVDSIVVKDKQRYKIFTKKDINEIQSEFVADNQVLESMTGVNLSSYSMWFPK